MHTLIKSTLVALLLPALATTALAGNGNGKGNGPGKGYGVGGCPPGLANKNPPCIPPGLARPKVGDDLEDYDYHPLTDLDRYRLDEAYSYYRVGELIYRIDPETFRVLEVIGLLDDLLR